MPDQIGCPVVAKGNLFWEDGPLRKVRESLPFFSYFVSFGSSASCIFVLFSRSFGMRFHLNDHFVLALKLDDASAGAGNLRILRWSDSGT